MLRQTSGQGLREPQEALREADVERDVELGQRAVAPAKGCARPEAHGPSRLAKALCSQDVSGTLSGHLGWGPGRGDGPQVCMGPLLCL